jgi:hypothetical protein
MKMRGRDLVAIGLTSLACVEAAPSSDADLGPADARVSPVDAASPSPGTDAGLAECRTWQDDRTCSP